MLDIATANGSTNTITVFYQNSGNTFAPGAVWGAGRGPRAVQSADLDGDGRPDIVVANHDSNTISVMLNRCLP